MKRNRVRELYSRYIDALEEWQIKLILARLEKFGLPISVWGDAIQEIVIVIHRYRTDERKQARTSKATILCYTIDNRILMFIRRHARYLAKLERLKERTRPKFDDYQPIDAAAENEVQEAVRLLTPQQRLVCEGLMKGDSMNRIALRMGKHHETIRRQVRAIRKIFAERGFDQWFA